MMNSEIKKRANELLQQGKKIEAIKLVRNSLNLNLIEAKELVEAAENELTASGHYNPPFSSRINSTTLLFLIFAAVGIVLLALAGFFYWKDYKNTKNSIAIAGVVSKLRYEGNATAPVVEYQWHGQKRIYSSNVFSSPSAFEAGETVEMLVNQDNPQIVVINQVTERYLVVIVLGFIAFVFLFIGGIGMKLNGAF